MNSAAVFSVSVAMPASASEIKLIDPILYQLLAGIAGPDRDKALDKGLQIAALAAPYV